MNVTEVPSQTGLAETEIDKSTGNSGFTRVVMVLDVAGFPEAQVSFESSLQLTMSLFTGIIEYVTSVAPGISLPFRVHW